MINWDSLQSDILINPAYSWQEQQKFYKIIDKASDWPGHVWIATSGSHVAKWVGLSKAAILASAQAVNHHLESQAADVWIQTLPDFHVGGLGVWARSYLSGASVANFRVQAAKWQPLDFYRFTLDHQGTLTSLVPAQLHDLVCLELESPPTLRAVLVGGGALSPELYRRAIRLGWKVLPTYGLTECASQVATARLGCWEKESYPDLITLPHIQIKAASDQRLSFKGTSLMSVYAVFEQENIYFIDPKEEGWLVSEDRGILNGSALQVLGRLDHKIKIGGENVDITCLESILEEIKLNFPFSQDMALVMYPDPRLGHVIHLAVASKSSEHINFIVQQFNQRVLPFERIRQVHDLPYIPRSALSKVLKKELLEMISQKLLEEGK